MRTLTETSIQIVLIPIRDVYMLTLHTIDTCLFFIPGKRVCYDMMLTALHGIFIGWHVVFPIYQACIIGIDGVVRILTVGY